MRKLRVFFSFAFVAVVAAGLGACGGDDDSSLRPDEQPDDVIASVDDLGDCTAKKAGDVELVGDTSYVCAKNDGKYDWMKVSQTEDEPESSSSKKTSSSSGKKTGSSSSKSKSSDSGKEIATNSSSSTSTSLSSSRNDKGGKSSSSMSSSSSKDVVQSSSEGSSDSKSSSSLVSETVDPSTVVMGTMTDERDGRTYKTVTIGTQTWMAENLNYAYLQPTAELDSSSFCYKDSVSYCEKYGRLYLWSAAMDSAGTWSTNGKGCGSLGTCSPTYPVRGVCPEGWHLPDTTEWRTLFTAVSGQSVASNMLKSTSGWNDFEGIKGNGTDSYSFTALPGGFKAYDGEFFQEGFYADFWSSTECNSYDAYRMGLQSFDVIARLRENQMELGFSVRCLKD